MTAMEKESNGKTTAKSPGEKREQTNRSRAYFLIPLLIIAVGTAVAFLIIKTSPQPRKTVPQKAVPQVLVKKIRLGQEKVTLTAMGTVVPARNLELKTRVGGEVMKVHSEFVDGGLIPQGEVVLTIDPADYRLAIAQKKSRVAEARYALKMELGYQDVAKREFELLGDGRLLSDLDRELALRKPHLEKARAEVAAAEAELDQALLDLERTRITAPFNALVLSKKIEKGAQVGTQETLAELVATDEYWVQVSLPVDRLGWFDIPRGNRDEGAPVLVTTDGGAEFKGRVLKLLGNLEEEGRMARILVAVPDPLRRLKQDEKQQQLLIGQYVRVRISGREMDHTARIPRSALHGGKQVWLVDANGKLREREVAVAWREEETILVHKGLKDGDRLVVTEMAAPEEGVLVQVVSEPAAHLSSGGEYRGEHYGS
jgi:RND family efflux transporter MFP subunit